MENSEPQLWRRYSPPNKLDKAPFNTRCLHIMSKKKADLYVQSSQDENNPQWQLMGAVEGDQPFIDVIDIIKSKM